MRVAIIFLVIITASCSPQNSQIPYKVGDAYIYKITVMDSNSKEIFIDTLTLIIKDQGIKGAFLDMNMSEWESKKYSEIKQARGINLEKDMVEMQTPTRLDYLEYENIVIAGYPSYSQKMKPGYTSESTHSFSKSYGKLGDLKLKQFSHVIDSSQLKFRDSLINCKVVEHTNQNFIEVLGQYRLQTFYNKDLGFIKMEYHYPNGKKIWFDLIERK